MSLRKRYCAAKPYADFLRDVEANADLWQALTRRAHVPPELVERIRALGTRWHQLVLAEDWCGDAVNTLPVFAKLADLAENLDLRVLSRDATPDLMKAHLAPTGAQAIPVVMVLDADFVERAWWGTRPAELQRWVGSAGLAVPKEERHREVRRWYARDRGVTALRELAALLERATTLRMAA